MHTNNGNATQAWLAAALAVIGILAGCWDIYVLYRGEPRGTVSWILLTWARQWPIFPFLCGVLAGHLFAPQSPPDTPGVTAAKDRDQAAMFVHKQ